MGKPDTESAYRLIIILCLALVTLAAFHRVLNNGFVFDDRPYVFENRHVQNGLTPEAVVWAFTSGHAANWHPVTWISHMLDCTLYGLEPWGHHLTNLLLHILNTVLLFLLLIRLTGFVWRSGFVAALFAVHPLHVESVAWVAERKDVLSMLFLLLTIWAYVRYAERPGVGRYLTVALLFALGLMSKPMLVTLPFVLLLLDYWPLGRMSHQPSAISHQPFDRQPSAIRRKGGRGSRRADPVTRHSLLVTNRTSIRGLLLEKVPLLAMSAALSVVTYSVQQAWGAMGGKGEAIPVGIRLANAFVAYVAYIVKMLWPADLAVLYPHPVRGLEVWQVLASALLLAAVTYLVIRASARRPYLAFGWLWYLGTLVPVIGLVQVGAQAMADRYTYIPLIGLFVVIAWGIPELVADVETTQGHGDAATRRWEKRGKKEERKGRKGEPELPRPCCEAATGEGRGEGRSRATIPPSPVTLYALSTLAVLSILVLSALTYKQTACWKNALTLFGHAIKVTRGNYLAHNNYGAALTDTGRIEEAAYHYREALRYRPNYVDALNNLGLYLSKHERPAEAEEHFRKAAEIEPGNAKTHCNLGDALYAQGRADESIPEYEEALRIDPYLAVAHNGLGRALSRQGNRERAMDEFREAIRLNPRLVEARYNLAVELTNQGRTDDAADEYRRILKIKPDYPSAHLNLGVILTERGKHKEAVPHYLEVVRLDPSNSAAHHNLAVSLFLTGDYAGAWEHVHACRRLGLEPDPRLVRDLSARMPDPG